MFQLVIVLVIIALALVYTVFSVVRSLQKKETSGCGDCNGCDIKSELTRNVHGKQVKNSSNCGCSA